MSTILGFVTRIVLVNAKAITALVVGLITTAGLDVDPTALTAVVTAFMVWLIPNRTTSKGE